MKPEKRSNLFEFWKTIPAGTKVVALDSQNRELSSRWEHEGFEYVLPDFLKKDWTPASVPDIKSSFKAIMLCKAILMDDQEFF